MGINDIIVYIVIGFFCLGAIDKCLGNKWGMGTRFTEGFMTMGSLFNTGFNVPVLNYFYFSFSNINSNPF